MATGIEWTEPANRDDATSEDSTVVASVTAAVIGLVFAIALAVPTFVTLSRASEVPLSVEEIAALQPGTCASLRIHWLIRDGYLATRGAQLRIEDFCEEEARKQRGAEWRQTTQASQRRAISSENKQVER
jgi:hypothetical protein